MSEEENAPKTHMIANAVNKGRDGKNYFTPIGISTMHKDGLGHTTRLNAKPIGDEIVHRYPKDVIEAMKAGKPLPTKDRDNQGHER